MASLETVSGKERLLLRVRDGDRAARERAARELRGAIEADAEAFRGSEARLLRLLEAEQDARVGWNLIQALAAMPLTARERSVFTDWLWEHLEAPSALTRVFCLQALWDLHPEEAMRRGRLTEVARRFLETGSAAMRARARKLLGARKS